MSNPKAKQKSNLTKIVKFEMDVSKNPHLYQHINFVIDCEIKKK